MKLFSPRSSDIFKVRTAVSTLLNSGRRLPTNLKPYVDYWFNGNQSMHIDVMLATDPELAKLAFEFSDCKLLCKTSSYVNGLSSLLPKKYSPRLHLKYGEKVGKEESDEISRLAELGLSNNDAVFLTLNNLSESVE